VLEQRDIRPLPRLREQGILDGPAGCICGMQNPPGGMTAFAGQMVIPVPAGIGMRCEGDAKVDQPTDGLGCSFDGETHGVRPVQTRTRDQGIPDMRRERILRIGHRGNPALGVQRTAFLQTALGENRNPMLRRQAQCQAQAGSAASDDQDIKITGRRHLLSK
jgi:hypothetical protein